nr:hypothetical protein [uncultured Halomonas sp.]
MNDKQRQELLDDIIWELDARIDDILEGMHSDERENCFDAAGEVFAYLAHAGLAPTLHFGEMLCGDTLITPHWWVEVAVLPPEHRGQEHDRARYHLMVDPTARYWLPDTEGVENVQRLSDLQRVYTGEVQAPEGLATSPDLISLRHALSEGLIRRFEALTGKKTA